MLGIWSRAMKSVKVSAEIQYEVQIGTPWRQALSQAISSHDKALIIVPEFIENKFNLIEQFSSDPKTTVFVTPTGEDAKTIDVANQIWEELGKIDLGRKDCIIGFGGGSTTDLAGFVAASWLRGVKWYAVATTLAGMVDAAVGGKTGINTNAGKNLVGAFHSPQVVYIDPTLLETLSDRDFASGLAEVIKCGYIADPSILEDVRRHPSLQGARSIAEDLIKKSVQVKADVVSQDFMESGLREILNYGHTCAHAVEKLSGYTLRHGEAVAIGLVFASYLSEAALNLNPEVTTELIAILTAYGLPTRIDSSKYSWESISALMLGDKKSRSGVLRFVGVRELGEPDWVNGPDASILVSIYERMSQ